MARLSLLVAEFGEDIPYAGALANGFPFRGRRPHTTASALSAG